MLAGLVLAANAVVLAVFWAHTSGASVIGFGRLAGLLLEYGLLLQLVLIGRVTWIEQLFGHDLLNRLHRALGYSLAALLVAHPLLLSIGYGSFTDLILHWPGVFAAFIGALVFVVVIFLSIPKVRNERLRLNYEAWRFTHLFVYLAIILAFSHQSAGGDFQNRAFFMYWIVLNFCVFGAYFMFRFMWPLWLFARHRFTVHRVVQESSDAWSVYLTGRHLEDFRFRAGQFANLSFFARGLWAPHPFSFSHEYDGRSLRFTIKSLGDTTGRISSLQPGTRVLLDGPLGVFTADRARTQKYLLIAGGIGVTPIRALAGELSARYADVVVLYSARSQQGAALLSELRTISPAVHVFIGEPARPAGGRIDEMAIVRAVPDVAERDAFICGPALMMDAMVSALRAFHVPQAQIHSEQFGY